MSRPAMEVADILRAQGNRFLERYQSSISYQQLKAFRAVSRCRTAALGGHIDVCHGCGYETGISYNSCRSRCCPKCQAQARQRWIDARQQELLPTNYFHVVFTVPHELIPLALTNAARFYDLLFSTSSQTLLEVAADPKRLGAEIGFLSILHTWGQNLLSHPHVHCVVPGGGLSHDHSRWVSTHPRFLLPVPVLRTLFRKKFCDGLEHLYGKGLLDCSGPAARVQERQQFSALLDQLRHKKWIVYAKPPFGHAAQMLRYLGRYTHRIAISNHRLCGFDGERVTFRWRDYAHGNRQRIMTLDATEFLRRFFLHVLPKGFVRIRHFGPLANRFRRQSLTLARKLLNVDGQDALPAPITSVGSTPLWHCPNCGGPMCVARRLTAVELSLSRDLDSS